MCGRGRTHDLELAQSVKHLIANLRTWVLSGKTKPDVNRALTFLALGRWIQDFWYPPASQDILGGFQATERPCCKNKVNGPWEMTVEVAIWPPHTCTHGFMYLHAHIWPPLVHTHMDIDTPEKEENMIKGEEIIMCMKGRIRFIHTNTVKKKHERLCLNPAPPGDRHMDDVTWRWAGVHGCEEDSLKVKIMWGGGLRWRVWSSIPSCQLSSAAPELLRQGPGFVPQRRNIRAQPFCNAPWASACNNKYFCFPPPDWEECRVLLKWMSFAFNFYMNFACFISTLLPRFLSVPS